MYVYIDALFRAVNGAPPELASGGLLSVDSPGVRDTPPYMLEPAAVILATDEGVMNYENGDTRELMKKVVNDLDRYMASNASLVGWYLDQVVVPVLCSACFMHEVNIPLRISRRLEDKWSKTMGFSVERAFLQGWYPSARTEEKEYSLTLDRGLAMCGLPTTSELGAFVEDGRDGSTGMSSAGKTLLYRVSSISTLFSRYFNLLERGK